VGIAGFTLTSIMSLAVTQKVPQIGILRSMGATKTHIGAIFIFQAFITWIISSIIGITLSLIIIELDKYYHLIQILFPGAVFFDFPLILQNVYIILIMFVSLILLLSSAIYPSIKAAHMDAVQAIGFRR
jgi:ABC-type antimicrobial peptide transport system permease subunit